MANLAEPIGEAWFTGNESLFVNGPFAGKTLGAVWPQMPTEWAGTAIERAGDFPLLVKFIFSQDKLSIQVHPDDEYAACHEQASGGRGKTEMWYVVDARPGAEVMVGLKSSVTREAFQRAIAHGDAEDCLERIPLRSGDAVFVPACTAHTIGPGLVLCEIQEHSDLTYRVYDYNRRDAQGRSRDLHIEKALEVIRFGNREGYEVAGKTSLGDQSGCKIEPVRIERGVVTETHYAACRYFATERWDFATRIEASSSNTHFELLIFLEGNGTICWRNDSVVYAPSHVWLIPAALGKHEILPSTSHTSLLRTYVPGDLTGILRYLAEHGASSVEQSRLLHS